MRKIMAWIPAICWMILLFYLSSRPASPVSQNWNINFLVFKTIHIGVYGILFALVRYALATIDKSTSYEKSLQAIIISMLYAISDEFHQSFVPTRGSRVYDIAFDTLGIFLVYCAWHAFRSPLSYFANKVKILYE